jgi:tetraacyldisaccharide 4'-kinase
MKYLRWLLLPISLIYGLVVMIRNFFYDAGIFKTSRFTKPVIGVGNLDIGGAGKSPMTEYLVQLLKDDVKVATLSRGYGRATKGFITATATATAIELGDEPAQFKHKFPDITVAVCEKRAVGIRKLLPGNDVVILDDAYQHRAVEAGLSILLFDYSRLADPHFLLPAGKLREPFSGRWRAKAIVVTKCPPLLTDDQKYEAAALVAPLPYQQLFFTSIEYRPLINFPGGSIPPEIDNDTTVFLLTGIANSRPLVEHLATYTGSIVHHNYPDHHRFTLKNIAKLAADFSACPAQKKLVITTEKDAQRLESSWLRSALPDGVDLPVFVAPISVKFLGDGSEKFNHLVTNYVREHTAYSSVH